MIILIVLFLVSAISLTVGRQSAKAGMKYGMCFLASLFPAALLLMSFLLILFGSRHPVATCFAALCAFALCECLIACTVFRQFRNKKIRRFLIPVAVCLAVFFGTFYGYWCYVDSIPTVGEGSSVLYDYDPIREGNRLAKLDSPASLCLTEDLPCLDGATALYPVYAAFANAVYPSDSLRFPEEYDWETFGEYRDILTCSTTSGAYQNLVDGEADIIFCAAPSQQQLDYAKEKGEQMVLTPIGRECFVFFVNAKNPLENLTVSQIRDIYSGKTTHWRDLGVDMGAIRAFQREEGSGSQSALIRFMGETPIMTAPTENVLGDMGGIIEKTADYRNFKNAIGYSFRFYSTEMVKNDLIKLLSLEGVAPTKENITNGTYPVSDCFYAITLSSNDNPNVDRLIEWILSPEGQQLIDKTGYVPIA